MTDLDVGAARPPLTASDAAGVVDEYLRAARAMGLSANVVLHQDRRAEIVARAGVTEKVNTVQSDLVSVRMWSESGTAFTVAPGSASPDLVLRRAMSARYLPQAPPEPVAQLSAKRLPGRQPSCDLSALAHTFAGATAPARLAAEIRADQVSRSVSVASTAGASHGYQTSTASALLRLTRPEQPGRPRLHIDRACFGADAAGVLEQLAESVLPACTSAVHSDPLPAGRKLPGAVLFDGSVAAGLLHLFARSLCADAVLQGRSRMAGRLGELVAATEMTIVDDAGAPGFPWCAPVDDEGTPTVRRELISAGILAGFLGNRETSALLPGAHPGNAWQASPAVPPRPLPANLWIEPLTSAEAVNGEVLRIVQSLGMHLANDITGDFSMGVTALVTGPGDEVAAVTATVAGNVHDMFRRARPAGTRIGWLGGSASYCGSPDLLVTDGLSVGR